MYPPNHFIARVCKYLFNVGGDFDADLSDRDITKNTNIGI